MDEILKFKLEVKENIANQANNESLKEKAAAFMDASIRSRYSYNFTWLGRPIIQYPQDIVAIQEIIYRVQPDLIIETGIAHGGSLILHASICELIGKGEVLGVDIDIREHNKTEILNHRMIKRISMIQGSSVAPEVIKSVKDKVNGKSSVMVILDSNHTHEHVAEELKAYAPFVTKDSYLIVLDTIIEHLPVDFFLDRPWGIGNNPKSAVLEFLAQRNNFINDFNMDNKLMISAAPNGYLKRID